MRGTSPRKAGCYRHAACRDRYIWWIWFRPRREIRGDAWQTGPHQAVILWRGKLLMNADTTALFRVPSGHDILTSSKSDPILLGRDEDQTPIAAYLLDAWDPAEFDPRS